MSHLTDAEFTDLLDGRLATERARHAETCDRCRARLDGVREILARTAEAGVPEPSPLFWDQFPAKVRQHVSAAPRPTGWHAIGELWTRPLWAVATALVVLAVCGAWPDAPGTGPDSPPPADTVAGPDTGADPDPVSAEEAWALVSAAAEQIGWEGVQEVGIAPRPGSVESAMGGLSDEEQERLIRLLEEELKRAGA